MLRKSFLAAVIAFCLVGSSAKLVMADDPPTYDFSWYDANGQVISKFTTSDLTGTESSPPNGATDYKYYDTLNSSDVYYVSIDQTPIVIDLSTADINTDPAQSVDALAGTNW